jgi:hypothetical protein
MGRIPMSDVQQLRSRLILARKMRNESTSNEVFDYWHNYMMQLINEIKEWANETN